MYHKDFEKASVYEYQDSTTSDSVDEFVLVEELAKKAFPRSKTPICDYVVMPASECDPEEPVISLDIARQLEYNSRYYEQKATSTNN